VLAAFEVGAGKIVGTSRERIVAEASLLLSDSAAYQVMSATANPFDDGHAAERIVDILAKVL